MEVILKRDVPNVGRVGELVRVKPGYARNFLLPRSYAIIADKGSKKGLEQHNRMIAKAKSRLKEESEARAEEIKKLSVQLEKRFNEHGKMFGSITTGEIADLLKAQGHEVDRRDVELPEIKDGGKYEVKLRLPGDVYSTITLELKAVVEKENRAPKVKKQKAEKAEASEGDAEEKSKSETKES